MYEMKMLLWQLRYKEIKTHERANKTKARNRRTQNDTVALMNMLTPGEEAGQALGPETDLQREQPETHCR